MRKRDLIVFCAALLCVWSCYLDTNGKGLRGPGPGGSFGEPATPRPGDAPADDAGTLRTLPPGTGDPMPRAVATDTYAPSEVTAGQLFIPTCYLVDARGYSHFTGPDVVVQFEFSPAEAVLQQGTRTVMAIQVGVVEVTCTAHVDTNGNGDPFDDAPLTDATPAAVTILPGPPAHATAVVTPVAPSYTVGEEVSVECLLEDEFGNEVEGISAAIHVVPAAAAVVDNTVSFDGSGTYDIYCDVPGLSLGGSEPVTVIVNETETDTPGARD